MLIGILAYVVAQMLVGIWVTRRVTSATDYLLAGRSLGLGLGTFTIFASWFGAETCIGAAGAIYQRGWAGGAADPFGYTVCLLLMGLLFAGRLRNLGLTTLADLFVRRYSHGVARLAVLLLAPTSVLWAAAQIRAFGQVLSSAGDFDVDLAIMIATLLVIFYTTVGGMLADVYNDLVHGVTLIVGLVILLVIVVRLLGGVGVIVDQLDPRLIFGGPRHSRLDLLEEWAIPIIGSMFSQEVAARVLASRSASTARRMTICGGMLYLVVGLIPVLIGLAGTRLLPELSHPEQLLPELARQHLNAWLYILFAGALISAILSTVDSALLAASALVSHNLILSFKPAWNEQHKLRTARLCTMSLGVVAYGLASTSESVHDLVEEASGFASAGVFVSILFAMYSRVGHARSATAAMLSGAAVWVGGAYIFDWKYPYLLSLVAALIAYLLGVWPSRRVPLTSP